MCTSKPRTCSFRESATPSITGKLPTSWSWKSTNPQDFPSLQDPASVHGMPTAVRRHCISESVANLREVVKHVWCVHLQMISLGTEEVSFAQDGGGGLFLRQFLHMGGCVFFVFFTTWIVYESEELSLPRTESLASRNHLACRSCF